MDANHAAENVNIAIVGLGYVGWPLPVEFGKQYDTVGFDLSHLRILKSGSLLVGGWPLGCIVI